jgi:predicted small metal-binding protein
MALKLKRRDVGFDCGWTTKGKTEDEILANCATHATKDHGMKPEEITDELKTKIKANIHKSWF